MNIILFKSNRVSNFYQDIIEMFYGKYGENLCLYYDPEENINYKRISDEDIDNMHFFISGTEVHDKNVYWVNTNKNIKKVIEKLSKYICKVVAFNDFNDFTEFKEFCESIAKKTRSSRIDNYTKYVRIFEISKCYIRKKNRKNDLEMRLRHSLSSNFSEFERYCIYTRAPSSVNDISYFTLEGARAKNLKCVEFLYVLVKELESMLIKRNIKEVFVEYTLSA